MKRGKIVYANLCAECHRKMELLYVLHDVPEEYARAGTGKCALCDFRGALTACRYDPAADKRTAAPAQAALPRPCSFPSSAARLCLSPEIPRSAGMPDSGRVCA